MDEEVILHDGMDAKAVALVIGELVAEAAGTELDAAYPLPGQVLQHEAQQAGADALLLAVGGNGDVEDLGGLLPTRPATQAPTTSLSARAAPSQGGERGGSPSPSGRWAGFISTNVILVSLLFVTARAAQHDGGLDRCGGPDGVPLARHLARCGCHQPDLGLPRLLAVGTPLPPVFR